MRLGRTRTAVSGLIFIFLETSFISQKRSPSACRRPVAAARRGSRGRAGGGRRTGTGGAGANGAGGRSSGGILSGSKPTDQLLGCGRSLRVGQVSHVYHPANYRDPAGARDALGCPTR